MTLSSVAEWQARCPTRQHGTGKPLHVRIDLNLPGKEIVVKGEPAAIRRSASPSGISMKNRAVRRCPSGDLRFVIHDAFRAAGRRVQDFARRGRDDVKRHASELVLTKA